MEMPSRAYVFISVINLPRIVTLSFIKMIGGAIALGAIENLQFLAMDYACEAYVKEAIDLYRHPYEIATEGNIGEFFGRIGKVLGGLIKKAIEILGNVKRKIISLLTDNNLYLSKENKEDIIAFKEQANAFTEEFDKLPSVKTLVSHLISRTEESKDSHFFNSTYVQNEVNPHIDEANKILVKLTDIVEFDRREDDGVIHLYEIPGKSIIKWIDNMIAKWRHIENELSDSSFSSYGAAKNANWNMNEINSILSPYQKLVSSFIVVLGKFQQFIMSRRKPTFDKELEEKKNQEL